MKQQLQEINDQYSKVDMYLNISVEQVSGLTAEELREFEDQREKAADVYSKVVEQFREIAPSLLPNEIIEGYEQAGKTLKAHLAGQMYQHFNEAYIPVMVKAINSDEIDGLYLFLNVLSQKLNREELLPLVLKALDGKSQRTRRAALEIVHELSLKQALPKVKLIVKDDNPGVAKLAQEIVHLFET